MTMATRNMSLQFCQASVDDCGAAAPGGTDRIELHCALMREGTKR